ncbi:aminoglycoside phosphotransferase family protein [Streptomyces phaeolivaceus]|uniref:Aminoglycoside phosphotransferase family protein n=1 Tax=Streptomyces phaeolivaceus TaxID=2653200 RepID=A0A5P8KAH1_9ACTN|nr:aminoglycoside phosphotransferase family protein [Streptomyces phaeolivaceus]QFQ99627.1 aminoglycoside phosphotransferase family protein [Streptomyces phaeolivaceus]
MRSRAGFIANVYGLDGGAWEMVPVARGALGQVWRLSGGGGVWAVKELLFGCDEGQVGREAGLRDAAEGLGISAPRFFADRDGAYVSRLPESIGGGHVKLYDWVEGSEADPGDPALLDWCGRTLALLHRAGEGTAETPDDWYERCPGAGEWAELCERVRRAGVPWAAALERFAAAEAVELAGFVTPSGGGGDVVTSHLDMRPQNVLVGPAGPALLDWDNAGPVSAGRELARAVHVWAGGNDFRADSARRLVRGYVDAGGPGVVEGVESFSMLFATELNYVRVQAECAVDPEVTAAQREFAGGQVVGLMGRLPDPVAASRLAEALASEW